MSLAAVTSGQGCPLVLIHAFPLSSGMWKPQIKSLELVSKVILLDLPGFGRSPSEAKPTISGMAQQVAGMLEAMKIKEPVMIAGLSMGGYVALEFVRQFPERVKALGLFSTKAGADTPEARDKRLKTAEQIEQGSLQVFVKKLLPSLVGKTALESNPSLMVALTGMLAANRCEGVASALIAMAERSDSTGILGTLKCPVLIMAGEEDTLIPSSEAELMRARLGDAQLHILPKAGHLINLEQPEAFNKILANFIIQKL